MKYLRLLMGRDNLAISCPPIVYCSLKNGLLDGAFTTKGGGVWPRFSGYWNIGRILQKKKKKKKKD